MAKKKTPADEMRVLLLRGYNPEEGCNNKKVPGDIITVSGEDGRGLIKAGIATFPDER